MRKGELEVRAYSWTFPPRAVFDNPVWQDSNPPHNAAPSPGRQSSRDRLTGTQAHMHTGGQAHPGNPVTRQRGWSVSPKHRVCFL